MEEVRLIKKRIKQQNLLLFSLRRVFNTLIGETIKITKPDICHKHCQCHRNLRSDQKRRILEQRNSKTQNKPVWVFWRQNSNFLGINTHTFNENLLFTVVIFYCFLLNDDIKNKKCFSVISDGPCFLHLSARALTALKGLLRKPLFSTTTCARRRYCCARLTTTQKSAEKLVVISSTNISC